MKHLWRSRDQRVQRVRSRLRPACLHPLSGSTEDRTGLIGTMRTPPKRLSGGVTGRVAVGGP